MKQMQLPEVPVNGKAPAPQARFAHSVVRLHNEFARAPVLARNIDDVGAPYAMPPLNPSRLLQLTFAKMHRGLPADLVVRLHFDELRDALPSVTSHNSWVQRLQEECQQLGTLQYHEVQMDGTDVWHTLISRVVLSRSRQEVQVHFSSKEVEAIIGARVASNYVQYRTSTATAFSNERWQRLFVFLSSYAFQGRCSVSKEQLSQMLDLPASTSTLAMVRKRLLDPFQAYCNDNTEIAFTYSTRGGYGAYFIDFAISARDLAANRPIEDRAVIDLLARRGLSQKLCAEMIEHRGPDHCLRALIVTKARERASRETGPDALRSLQAYLTTLLQAEAITDRQLPQAIEREALRLAFIRGVFDELPATEQDQLRSAYLASLSRPERALFEADNFGARQGPRFLAFIDDQMPAIREVAPFLWEGQPRQKAVGNWLKRTEQTEAR